MLRRGLMISAGIAALLVLVIGDGSVQEATKNEPSIAAGRPALSEAEIDTLLAGKDDGSQQEAVDAILAHPESINPYAYASVTGFLWSQGRRRQAAFWFYLFQIRSRPWAVADQAGDGAAALRFSLDEKLGAAINSWVFSDVASMREITRRAVSYEKGFPLYEGMPKGVPAAQWADLVGASRTAYEAEMTDMLAKLDAESVARQRRANGLYVGPLQSPGPELPQSWQ